MPSDFQLVPTPNPLEVMVSIVVPDKIVNEKLALKPTPNGLYLAEGLTYSKFYWAATPPRVQDFGHYRYAFMEKAGADATRFFFAKPRTDKEKNTPFKVIKSTRQYVWPAVLLDFYIIRSSFDISNNNGSTVQNAARYFPRFRFVPATPHDSLIEIEQFLSDTPWHEKELVHPQPVPTDIDGSYLGTRISFPRCLHRRVTLPELVPGAAIVLGAGMEGSDRFGTPREQVFPSTNFATWVPFYIEDVVQPQRGLYLRERVRIHPPPQGEAVSV
jgi:hypothetical protein